MCSHGAVHRWSVVVPAKRLAVAKTRLRPLTAAATTRRTPASCWPCWPTPSPPRSPAPPSDAVLVVTDDPAPRPRSPGLGARTVPDEPDRGLNPALEHGARGGRGPAVAALSSDLPALRPGELAAALGRRGRPRRAASSPTPHGTGTTLLTAVGTELRPRFGRGLGGGAPGRGRGAADRELAGPGQGRRHR